MPIELAVESEKFAFAVGEWAQVCSVSEAEVKRAIQSRQLIARVTECGRLVIARADGVAWLAGLREYGL